MGQVHGVNQRRMHQLAPDTDVELFEVGTAKGHSFVGVLFERRLQDGGRQEFRTDLARLEEAARLAREYAGGGEQKSRDVEVGDVLMRMSRVRADGRDPGSEVMVTLAQKARDGSGEWQRATLREGEVDAAVQHGRKLERELGIGRPWFVLVDSYSVSYDEKGGRIHGKAVRSFDDETQARMHLGKSSGLALYSVPQSREFARGEAVELWAGATLLESRRARAMPVERHLEREAFHRERESEHYVVARWNDVSRAPEVGGRATWSGRDREYNGDPQEYQAGPASGRDPGRPAKTLFVLIEKGEGVSRKGRIVSFSEDRKAMTEELAARETLKQDQLLGQKLERSKQEQEAQRAVNQDWEKQSFTMDRREYTRGHSL